MPGTPTTPSIDFGLLPVVAGAGEELALVLPDALLERMRWAVGDRLAWRLIGDHRLASVRRLEPHGPIAPGECVSRIERHPAD